MLNEALPSSFPLWIIMSVLPLNSTEADTVPSASPVPSLDSAMPGTLVPLETETMILLNNDYHTQNSEQKMLSINYHGTERLKSTHKTHLTAHSYK